MKKLSYLLLLLTLLLIFTAGPVLALEAGGKVQIGISGSWEANGEVESEINESLQLELFLPKLGEKTEAKYEFVLSKPLQDLLAGEEVTYFTRKLYLKHRFEDFHLTVGKQPISWSFGSLLNPVDFTLGAVALDEENNSKFQDAVELYIPVNWNSNLVLVSAFPAGFDWEKGAVKWGVRGRMGVKGYDLTLNYVQEAANSYSLLPLTVPEQRMGLTFKGDLKDLGVYGALAYYFSEDSSLETSKSLLLGADYSYQLDYYTKITLQLEYLGLGLNFLAPCYREGLFNLAAGDERLDLLAANISYPLDDFSSLSLVSLVDLDDQSLILSPGYQTTLPNDLELALMFSFFLGEEGDFLAAGKKNLPLLPIPLALPQGSVGLSLGYSF